jgi:hypothetical protein
MTDKESIKEVLSTDILIKNLVDAGLNVDDADIAKAMEITAKFYLRALNRVLDSAEEAVEVAGQGTVLQRRMLENLEFAKDKVVELAEENEKLYEQHLKTRRQMIINSLIPFLIGLAAAVFSATGGVFIHQIHQFLTRLFSLLLIPSAFAQQTTSIEHNGPDSYIRIAVYSILGLSYVVGFFTWHYGPQTSRKGAGEYVRTLTTFFIGTVSGKVI